MYLVSVVLAARSGSAEYRGKGYQPLVEVHVGGYFGLKSTDAAAQFAMLMLGID